MKEDELNIYQRLKNLGYVSSWGETPPPEIVKCNSLGHVLKDVVRFDFYYRLRGCVTEKYCPICNYYYRIDSSGY